MPCRCAQGDIVSSETSIQPQADLLASHALVIKHASLASFPCDPLVLSSQGVIEACLPCSAFR
jgi:hypothetical protein